MTDISASYKWPIQQTPGGRRPRSLSPKLSIIGERFNVDGADEIVLRLERKPFVQLMPDYVSPKASAAVGQIDERYWAAVGAAAIVGMAIFMIATVLRVTVGGQWPLPAAALGMLIVVIALIYGKHLQSRTDVGPEVLGS
jgi:hypothetical protein